MKIKNSLLIFLLLILTAICFAQQSNADIEIINSGKPLTNEMIFFSPDQFKRNKEPLFYVNDRQVVSIAMFNKDELKKITYYNHLKQLKSMEVRERTALYWYY